MMRPQGIGMESDLQKEWKYRLDKGVVQSLDFKEGPVVNPGAVWVLCVNSFFPSSVSGPVSAVNFSYMLL